MSALIDTTIPVLERTPRVLRALMEGLPQGALETPGPEGWSPKDVLAHLASVQGEALGGRVERILAEEGAFLSNIDEDEALQASGMGTWTTAALLDRFEADRARIMQVVSGISTEQVVRSGQHEIAGTLELRHILHHFAFHDLMHLRQIADLLLAPLDGGRGPMAGSFPDQG